MLSSKRQQAIGMFVFGVTLLLLGVWMLDWIPTYTWQISKAIDASAPAVTAIATGFIAWFTLTLKRATDKLWDAGERQLKSIQQNAAEQSRDMKESLAAARQAAEAAAKSAETAEKAFTLLERPYVIPDNVNGLRPVPDYFGHPTGAASFRIGNYGKVPAIVHRVGARFAMIELPVTKEKLHSPNFAPGQEMSVQWNPSMVLAQGLTHELPAIYVPHGMQNVEIVIIDDVIARPKVVAQHQFFLHITVEYEDAVSNVMLKGTTLWALSIEGFIRYGSKRYNYEDVVGVHSLQRDPVSSGT